MTEVTPPVRPAEGFTHLDSRGKASMVDVTSKPLTARSARASCSVVFAAETVAMLPDGALTAANEAARNAVVRTSYLIPLCHPIPVDDVAARVQEVASGYHVTVEVSTRWKTGVEMEALAGACAAALTVVAALMQDGVDARVLELAIDRKSGGKSGDWGRSVVAK